MARAKFAVSTPRTFFFTAANCFSLAARGQNIAAMFRKPGKNSRHLRGSLAFSKDNFGHAGAQGAMMVDLGEAEVFERQMAQARDRVIGRELALAHLLEELADGFGVHDLAITRSSNVSALGSQPDEV